MSELVLPGTGEIVSLEDPADAAALWFRLKTMESQCAEIRRRIANEVLAAEAERLGTKTLHMEGVGKVKMTGGPESETVWDIERLRSEMRAAGLPDDRLALLIKTTVEYKVDGNVARQLAGANPEYARIIDSCKKRVDKPWRVE